MLRVLKKQLWAMKFVEKQRALIKYNCHLYDTFENLEGYLK